MGYYDAHDGMTIKQISELWRKGDKAYDHTMPIWIDINEVWKYRDYDWTKETSRAGWGLPYDVNPKQEDLPGPQKWDSILNHMKEHGWNKRDPLRIILSKTGKAKVGEGNHRLAIARLLKMPKVPAMFIFYNDSYQTSDTSYPPRTVESFRQFIEDELPPQAGSQPIPKGHIRLYHYINAPAMTEQEIVHSIKQNGIDISKSKGHTYGEPNMVWASGQIPNKQKIFVEFTVPWNDPRLNINKPNNEKDAERIMSHGSDVTFNASIKPQEIIAVHLPWHWHCRYLIENDKIPEILAGKFDYLKGKEEYEPALNYIKRKYGH